MMLVHVSNETTHGGGGGEKGGQGLGYRTFCVNRECIIDATRVMYDSIVSLVHMYIYICIRYRRKDEESRETLRNQRRCGLAVDQERSSLRVYREALEGLNDA